ncbi:33340_t:CDS:1 [Racocetra persica]|uniref:33340_t:CDS:1 n=1 Tax=Racocetra persica TaxID=160502 RepID=A0ACA9PYC2_9GLOM|nr:33340_t:CDS:1 [Racocetra persica]
MANLSCIAEQIASNRTLNIHEFDPLRVIPELASRWDQQRYVTGYEVLKFIITPTCNNAHNISNPTTIDAIARYIWVNFTLPTQRDVYTNAAFRTNERKFGPSIDKRPMRDPGILVGQPAYLHTDFSDQLFNGSDHLQ